MSMSPDPETAHQIERMADDLCSEFAGRFSRAQIEEVMNDSSARVLETATVFEFVPLMAYRFTRERLNAITRAAGHAAAGNWDVVFVSLSGGGRGQIAAAITTALSDGRVSVHSAGTTARRLTDPGVRTVIEELGLDPDHEFARPVTGEVMRAAHVIVTMGHSVGVVEIPQGVRHEDWRVGDPIGAPTDEVRHVRHDIEYRVRALLDDPRVSHTYETAETTTSSGCGTTGSDHDRTPTRVRRPGYAPPVCR